MDAIFILSWSKGSGLWVKPFVDLWTLVLVLGSIPILLLILHLTVLFADWFISVSFLYRNSIKTCCNGRHVYVKLIKFGDALETRHRIIFKFYPGLLQIFLHKICHLRESKLCLLAQYFVPRPNRSHAHTLRPQPTDMVWTSLVPRPSWKVKEGLVFWATFLVTWGGAYSIKNVIIAFYIRDSSFVTT